MREKGGRRGGRGLGLDCAVFVVGVAVVMLRGLRRGRGKGCRRVALLMVFD